MTVVLVCRGPVGCPSRGIPRVVPLEPVVSGVLARPNFICADCHLELALFEQEVTHAGPG